MSTEQPTPDVAQLTADLAMARHVLADSQRVFAQIVEMLENRPALMRSAIVAALVSAGMDEAAAVAARVEVL